MTKLTVADILERKNIIKPLKLTYNSEILGGEIEIKKINADKVMDIAQDMQDNKYQTFCKLIFACCPIFSAKELQQKYKPIEPFDIVDILLESSLVEVTELAMQILELYGIKERIGVNNLKK